MITVQEARGTAPFQLLKAIYGFCYGRPLLQAWLLPDLIRYLTTALERILFSSMVMVLAFRPGVLGSNPAQTLYFCHAFIHLFLCYRLCW